MCVQCEHCGGFGGYHYPLCRALQSAPQSGDDHGDESDHVKTAPEPGPPLSAEQAEALLRGAKGAPCS